MKFSSSTFVVLTMSASTLASPQTPWNQLKASLSSPDILTRPSIAAFIKQCTGTYLNDTGMTSLNSIGPNPPVVQLFSEKGSNWFLIDQPSGICLDTLSCAFENCRFPTSFIKPDLTTDFTLALGPDYTTDVNLFAELMTANEELLNFPDYVVHPDSVADIVASVIFAKEHGIPLTVKTTGHHFSGAGQRKGTLNINTRRLPVYTETIGVHDCTGSYFDDWSSYIFSACRLALDRGKTGIIRVGGGEDFNGLLKSVLAYNNDPDNINKYHAVSGGAGSVSAAGGWLASGGNSAARGSRLYGLGVDQVLQMEMVLLDGTFVRFGPAEWRREPEYIYPKTTLVKGYCAENPLSDEKDWLWKECNVVNFNDLWMAVRGGGGGTWGIVTSLIYQLHARPIGGTHQMKFLPLTNNTDTWRTILDNPSMVLSLDETVEDFKIEFYHQPETLGVSEDDSNACGCDFIAYPHFRLPPWSHFSDINHEATCLGEKAAEAWVGAWQKFVVKGAGKERLLKVGFTASQLNELGSWAYGNDWRQQAEEVMENSSKQLFQDYTLSVAQYLKYPTVLDFVNSFLVHEDLTTFYTTMLAVDGDKYPDNPKPFVNAPNKYTGLTCTILSLEFVLKHREVMVSFLVGQTRSRSPWYTVGGAISKAHDQMTAIPRNRREGAIYIQLHFGQLETFLPMMFEGENNSTFPGFVGHNHWIRHGPLKTDWTKACPLSYSKEEMDKLCISEQEAVWGTDLLGKLEQIKEEIDPNMIMTCETGVGFGSKGHGQAASPSSTPLSHPIVSTLVVIGLLIL